MKSYCILIKNPNTEKQKILETLKVIHSFTDEQAIEYSKNNPGFLAENLTYEKAREILSMAERCQMSVMVLETKSLPVLREPQIFKKAVVQPTGFTYFIGWTTESCRVFPGHNEKDKEFVPFDRIILIIAGIISEKEFPKSIEEIRKELSIQIESLYGQKTDSIKTEEKTKTLPVTKERIETNFYLDIFFNKSPYRIRMKSDDFDYSYLGKRKSFSSLENFRSFLDDVSAIALKAYKNKTIDALIKKRSIYPYKYPSISAYEKEVLWLLTCFSRYGY